MLPLHTNLLPLHQILVKYSELYFKKEFPLEINDFVPL